MISAKREANELLERMIDAEIDGDREEWEGCFQVLRLWSGEGKDPEYQPDWDRWKLKGLPWTQEAKRQLTG